MNTEEYNVICLDESQYLTIFKRIEEGQKMLNKMEFKVEQAAGMPKDVASKDLFGMGYPYFVSWYDKYVALTSDYGVLLFQIN